jgi:hypothetical protein
MGSRGIPVVAEVDGGPTKAAFNNKFVLLRLDRLHLGDRECEVVPERFLRRPETA